MRIRRLWRAALYFARATKVWRWPRQSEVLIFDATGKEYLLEFLHSWNPEVLYTRGEQINVPVMLMSLFRGGARDIAYIDSYIEKVRPRLVITIIDNDMRFNFLATRNRNIKTLFVQNGPRSSEIFTRLDNLPASDGHPKVDYMTVVASRYVDLYTKRIQGTVIPIGNIRNNQIPRQHAEEAGSIAFISQFRDIPEGFVWGGKFRTHEEFFARADRIVLSFLLDYSWKHGKKLFIIPSYGWSKGDILEKEKAYYEQLMGHSFTFSEWSWHGSSYDAADAAEVVVCIDSALGYESAARGNKTAILAIRSYILQMDDRVFGWPLGYPDEGPFWTNLVDEDIFGRILDHLFAIDDQQWKAELEEHSFDSVMAYDPGNAIFKSTIESILGPKKLGAPSDG